MPADRSTVLGGVASLVEESHALPLVDLAISFRTGGLADPRGKDGLTRMMGRMLRMGTRKLSAAECEEAIARLGARLSIDTGSGYFRLHGTVIRRNLEAFVALLADLLLTPAFRSRDLGQAKRETFADLVAARDNDRGLASRQFRSALFRSHPYSRSIVGTRATLRSLTREDLIAQHTKFVSRRNAVFGAAGAVTSEEWDALIERYFGLLPDRRVNIPKVPAPKVRRGRHLVIVDKPERTQTQMFIGSLGTRWNDPQLYPLSVANTAFGGMFTARLMQEVRVRRGWSYGAYSRLGQNEQRDAWYMWSHPSMTDAAACARLELGLLEGLVDRGISMRELRFAKSYLTKSHCFEVDTASKRLEAQIDLELYGLPQHLYTHHVQHVRAVQLPAANTAIRERLTTRDLTIAVLASADKVRADLEALPGLSSVTVVPFDQD